MIFSCFANNFFGKTFISSRFCYGLRIVCSPLYWSLEHRLATEVPFWKRTALFLHKIKTTLFLWPRGLTGIKRFHTGISTQWILLCSRFFYRSFLSFQPLLNMCTIIFRVFENASENSRFSSGGGGGGSRRIKEKLFLILKNTLFTGLKYCLQNWLISWRPWSLPP